MAKNGPNRATTQKKLTSSSSRNNVKFQAALNAAQKTVREKLLGAKATKDYGGALDRFAVWVEETHNDAVEEHGLKEDPLDAPGDILVDDLAAPEALDGLSCTAAFRDTMKAPKGMTPLVIAAYCMKKTLPKEEGGDGTKYGVVEQAVSALLKHFDQLGDGNTYRGAWQYVNGRWIGNPARAGSVQDLKKSLRNEHTNNGIPRRHAEPMTRTDMANLHKWTYLKEGSGLSTEEPISFADFASGVHHAMFRTFATVAFGIWGRCFEVLRLRWGDIQLEIQHPNPEYSDLKYDCITLMDRKGSEMKRANTSFSSAADKEVLEGQRMNFYSERDAEDRDLDVTVHIREWKRTYEGMIERSVKPEDYVFPHLARIGRPNPAIAATHEWVDKMLKALVAHTPSMAARNGNYTTHCFRRGAAQYRYIFAPAKHRWRLDECQGWGGWARGQNRYTIIKYLIDESSHLDSTVADIQCPARRTTSTATEVNFLVAGLTTMFENWKLEMRNTLAELQELARHQSASVFESPDACEDIMNRIIANLNSSRLDSDRTMTQTSIQQAALPSQSATAAQASAVSSSKTKTARAHPSSARLNLQIPSYEFGPVETHWENILKDWQNADPTRNLNLALKDWDPDWLVGTANTPLAASYRNRKLVAEHFLVTYNGDAAAFKAKYYPDGSDKPLSIAGLLREIKKHLIQVGEIKTRKRRPKSTQAGNGAAQ